MKHLFLTIIVLFGGFVNVAQAQDTRLEEVSLGEMPKVELPSRPIRQPGEYGELQYWLNKKDPAPFAGVIVNPEGWSYVLTEYQALELRAREALRAQRERDHAYINLRVGELQVELNNVREVSEIKLAARAADLQRQQDINKAIMKDAKKSNRRGKILFGTGGLVIGIVGGILLNAFLL